MRSYAARHTGEPRAMTLLAPGWIRTALGGPAATFVVGESIPKIVDVLLDHQARPRLRFLDRFGKAARRPPTQDGVAILYGSGAVSDLFVGSVKVVAGTGFEPVTFRL